MKRFVHRLAHWLLRKTAGGDFSTGSWEFSPARRRSVHPTPADLLNELKGAAWTCATINAAACASHPPRLFVSTSPGQPSPKCPVKAVDALSLPSIRQRSGLGPNACVEEIMDHPLLTLLRQVNPAHNSFDLWELTALYLETLGSAYWLLDIDPLLQIPREIWVLPSQAVTPRRAVGSPRLVDHYEVRGETVRRFSPDRVVHFRFPDPRDPYGAGLSPLRACYEQASAASDYAEMKRQVYEQGGLPGVLLTPDEPLSGEERDRLEKRWRDRMSRGAHGRAIVAEGAMKATLLSQSMGDLAALADLKATKEDIANAFHVPTPMLSGDTNLANMQAADHLHKTLAILPRLRRRDEKLNEQFVPWYDPTGRLFLATPDPTPANQQFLLQQEQSDLRHGVRTVNEVRAARGLPPLG